MNTISPLSPDLRRHLDEILQEPAFVIFVGAQGAGKTTTCESIKDAYPDIYSFSNDQSIDEFHKKNPGIKNLPDPDKYLANLDHLISEQEKILARDGWILYDTLPTINLYNPMTRAKQEGKRTAMFYMVLPKAEDHQNRVNKREPGNTIDPHYIQQLYDIARIRMPKYLNSSVLDYGYCVDGYTNRVLAEYKNGQLLTEMPVWVHDLMLPSSRIGMREAAEKEVEFCYDQFNAGALLEKVKKRKEREERWR